jgi:general secretion pathway protein E
MQEPYVEIHEAGRVRKIAIGNTPLTVGRSSENRAILSDHLSSRYHCLISRNQVGFTLKDLNSSNGTILNGAPTRMSRIYNGDELRIGQTSIFFHAPNGEADPPADQSRGSAHQIPLNIPMVEPADTEPLDFGVNLDDVPDIVPVEEDQEEIAEPLTDDQLLDDPDSPILMEPEGEEQALEIASIADPEASVEQLVQSLPDRSFGESDIALISARGQMTHRPGAPAPRRGQREAVDWLRLLLLLCSRGRATDIHVEPKGADYVLRVRIDASMVEVCHLPNAIGSRLAALVKVLGEIDMTQKNTIQEGHFSARVPGARRGETRRIDYRVSFAPSVFGQKLVVRVLDASQSPLSIGALQMPKWMQEETEKVICQDAGMCLVCGPTGSGKTTTLYALLRGSDISRRNVVTIEDPVEIQLEGVTQIPVDEEQGKTFSNLLRSTLRQDPDVILIGEIRDAETARIAMQASITGHLVFSTLHTQNTIGTVFRLLDLGTEPYLVAQAMQLVIAQRLVKQLCPFCKMAVKPTTEQIERLGKFGENVDRIYSPHGCPKCMGTGFAGRRAIFELLTATDELRELISHTATALQLQNAATKGKFTRLHESGFELVADGAVSFEEIDRAVGRDR